MDEFVNTFRELIGNATVPPQVLNGIDYPSGIWNVVQWASRSCENTSRGEAEDWGAMTESIVLLGVCFIVPMSTEICLVMALPCRAASRLLFCV